MGVMPANLLLSTSAYQFQRLENRHWRREAEIRRDRPTYRLLMFTGERLREILTLKWTDINFERGVDQSFRQQTGKKTIVMSAVTADLLKDSVRRGTFVVPGLDADRSRSGLQKPWRAVQRHAA